MKNFRYKAKKGPNEIIEGTLAADTREGAIDKVNELGLVPVDIQEAAQNRERKEDAPRRLTVKGRQLLAFYRQLSKLVKSGVPILQALYLISSESENNSLQQITRSLHKEVREGSTLSAAMGQFPRVFPAFDIGMVQTGEAAGRLDEVLARVSEYRERQREIISKVRGALAYPAFISVMGCFTVAFILTNVIPKFSRFYADLGQELPLITRILIHVSGWLQDGAGWILIGICMLGLFLVTVFRKEANRTALDAMVLRIPLAGKVILKSEIARFCRTLELLLKSGVPILAATRIAVPVITNRALRRRLEACHQQISQGGSLSGCLKSAKYFPSFVCYFVSVGEESGKIEESLHEISEWYEQDTRETVKIMTSFLEPVIILAIGAILAVIIIAVLLPVFSINTMIV